MQVLEDDREHRTVELQCYSIDEGNSSAPETENAASEDALYASLI